MPAVGVKNAGADAFSVTPCGSGGIRRGIRQWETRKSAHELDHLERQFSHFAPRLALVPPRLGLLPWSINGGLRKTRGGWRGLNPAIVQTPDNASMLKFRRDLEAEKCACLLPVDPQKRLSLCGDWEIGRTCPAGLFLV